MTHYMAFLRAINVGGRTVKMDQLRTLFDALGFANVSTFIASGNVVFETGGEATPAHTHGLERAIEQHLLDALGYDVDTFVRTSAQVSAVASYQPFPADDLETEGNQLYVAFLHETPDASANARLMDLRTDVDDFHVHEAEAYWLRRRTVGQSAFTGAALEKAMGTPSTMRNINTVRRMTAKFAPKSPVDGSS